MKKPGNYRCWKAYQSTKYERKKFLLFFFLFLFLFLFFPFFFFFLNFQKKSKKEIKNNKKRKKEKKDFENKNKNKKRNRTNMLDGPRVSIQILVGQCTYPNLPKRYVLVSLYMPNTQPIFHFCQNPSLFNLSFFSFREKSSTFSLEPLS